MIIRHIFHNETDLAVRFTPRFYKRWKALVGVYRKRRRMDGVNVLRVASVAMAFYGAAENGDLQTVSMFDEMLYGRSGCLEMDGERVCVNGEDDCTRLLMWDMACLMIEENAGLAEKAQIAFDVASDRHTYAFDDDVMWVCEEKPVTMPGRTVGSDNVASAAMPEVKKMNSAVPAIPKDVMEWMVRDATERGDEVYAGCVEAMLTRNIMQRYHGEVFDMLQEMNRACRSGGDGGVSFNAPVTYYGGTVTGNVTNNNRKS